MQAKRASEFYHTYGEARKGRAEDASENMSEASFWVLSYTARPRGPSWTCEFGKLPPTLNRTPKTLTLQNIIVVSGPDTTVNGASGYIGRTLVVRSKVAKIDLIFKVGVTVCFIDGHLERNRQMALAMIRQLSEMCPEFSLCYFSEEGSKRAALFWCMALLFWNLAF